MRLSRLGQRLIVFLTNSFVRLKIVARLCESYLFSVFDSESRATILMSIKRPKASSNTDYPPVGILNHFHLFPNLVKYDLTCGCPVNHSGSFAAWEGEAPDSEQP